MERSKKRYFNGKNDRIKLNSKQLQRRRRRKKKKKKNYQYHQLKLFSCCSDASITIPNSDDITEFVEEFIAENDIIEKQQQQQQKITSIKKNEDFSKTLTPVSNLGRCEIVAAGGGGGGGGEVTNNENHQRAFIPLDSDTKFRDQWMRQPSDLLSLEHSKTLQIEIKKSTKSKMKNQAKMFCTTNRPMEQIQRGTLINIYMFLIMKLNPFSVPLNLLSSIQVSWSAVLLSRVIPHDLQDEIYTHLFSKREKNLKNASSNSKKKISNIGDMIEKKENHDIFAIINRWLWKNLPSEENGKHVIKCGKQLPLEMCVTQLTNNRNEIIKLYKALDEVQCRVDSIDSYLKIYEHIQQTSELQSMQLLAQSGRSKIQENIVEIGKITNKLKQHKYQQQQQQQQQQQHDINTTMVIPISKRKKQHEDELNNNDSGGVSATINKKIKQIRNSSSIIPPPPPSRSTKLIKSEPLPPSRHYNNLIATTISSSTTTTTTKNPNTKIIKKQQRMKFLKGGGGAKHMPSAIQQQQQQQQQQHDDDDQDGEIL